MTAVASTSVVCGTLQSVGPACWLRLPLLRLPLPKLGWSLNCAGTQGSWEETEEGLADIRLVLQNYVTYELCRGLSFLSLPFPVNPHILRDDGMLEMNERETTNRRVPGTPLAFLPDLGV